MTDKIEAAKEAILTNNNSSVARKLGIHESTIRDWIEKYISIDLKLEL